MLIKPNFVTSKNFEEHLRGEKLACSSTHGSVLRPILDYALRAAGPRGKVTIVDTPVEGCNLEEVVDGLGVRALLDWYAARGTRIDFIDLRHFRVVPHMALDDVRRFGRSFNLGLLLRERLPGDPLGYTVVDLARALILRRGRRSARRASASTARTSTRRCRTTRAARHEYSIPRTVLDADVVINIPKLKTHKKSGVTLALKSCIGLTNEKYWLPHYTAGTPAEDGDEFPFRAAAARCASRTSCSAFRCRSIIRSSRARRRLAEGRSQNGFLHGFIMEGSWEGNDTIWRTVLDLNQMLFYADRDGPPARSAAATLPGHRRRHHRRRGRRAAGLDAAPLPACSSPDAIRCSSTPPARAPWATASARSA